MSSELYKKIQINMMNHLNKTTIQKINLEEKDLINDQSIHHNINLKINNKIKKIETKK